MHVTPTQEIRIIVETATQELMDIQEIHTQDHQTLMQVTGSHLTAMHLLTAHLKAKGNLSHAVITFHLCSLQSFRS